MFRFPKYLCIFREKLVQFKTIIDHLFHMNSPAGYHLFTTVRFNQSLIIYSPQAGYHGQMWGRTQRQTYLFEQLTFFVKDSNCIWTVCCLCCISQFYECDVTCFSLEGTELRCFTYDKYGTERRTEAGLRSLARVKPSEKHLGCFNLFRCHNLTVKSNVFWGFNFM